MRQTAMRTPDETLTHDGPEGGGEDSGPTPPAATPRRVRLAVLVQRGLAGTERRRRTTVIAASIALVVGAAMTTLAGSLVAEIRIVNASSDPLWLSIDGARPVRLATIAAETPFAGLSLRLFGGRRELVVTADDGTRVDARTARLAGGETYLYAPGAIDQCFWLQHDVYGEARPELPPLAPLEGGPLFALPRPIDAWFFPNPAPSAIDQTSSGGARTAVRMARCGLPPWR